MSSANRVAILLLALAAVTPLAAQSTSATVRGAVRSSDGRPLPDAQVRIVSQTTGFARSAVTGEKGTFAVPGLSPGAYVVSAAADGFAEATTPRLDLTVGERRELTLTLQAEGEQSDLRVKANSAEALVVTAEIDAVVDQQFVSQLPLNGRSFQSLIAMAPAITQAPETEHTRGMFAGAGVRPSSTYFTVDGVSAAFGIPGFHQSAIRGSSTGAVALTASGSTAGLVAVDSMREFKVLTTGYAPEYGRAAGAQVAIVTRSGTNQLHGSLFNYFRNDKLDAAGWFANRNGLEKPATRQNNYGGTVGGPVIKDRTFFFGAFEGLRLRQPNTLTQAYPTAEIRRAAAGNMQPILGYYPLPNRGDLGGGLGLFSTSYTSPSELEAFSGRVDHVVNGSTMLFGRFSQARSSYQGRGDKAAVSAPISVVNDLDADTTVATIGLLQMLGGSFTNDLRFNYSRAVVDDISSFDGSYGGVGADASVLLPKGLGFEEARFITVIPGIPALDIGVFTNSEQTQWAFADSLTWLKGSHEVKIGVDIRQLDPNYGEPKDRIVGIFTGLFGPFGALGGRPVSAILEEPSSAKLRFRNWSAFAQDTWKPSARWTVTYGLRWDYNPAPTRRDDLAVYPILDADRPGVLRVGAAGGSLFDAPKDSFAPRLGLAYRLSDKAGWETVVRGGAGVFFDLPGGSASAMLSGAPYYHREAIDPGNFPFSPDEEHEHHELALDAPFERVVGFEPGIHAPRTYSANVGFTQGLGDGRSLQVSYIGTRGSRLWRRLGQRALSERVLQYHLIKSDVHSDYHALQANFQQKLRRGFQAFASYTYSHAIDEASDLATIFPWPAESDRANHGSSDFDLRHVATGGLTYDIPAPRAFQPVLGGWGVDAIWRLQSAPPVDVIYESADPDAIRFRPDVVPGQAIWLYGDQYPGGRALNPSAFVYNQDDKNGNLGRNAFRGFPLRQIDLAVRRRFKITESVGLQLRGEMFNVLNVTNFAPPEGNLTSTFFGQSTEEYSYGLGRGGLAGGQNPLHAAGGPRSVQVSLRLSF